MDTLTKIYQIHKELSKTENLINGITKSLDELAEKYFTSNNKSRYKDLNDILIVLLNARSKLQEELRKVSLQSLSKRSN